ncbi:alpha/beta fold hydrolase [Nocardioides nematodiphilus]|uniref:alpha/beta fold hydrolase n=1 Tax=Nocardioides nematodiphilus TaxID=2849669 RepID=UPI001CD9BA66|nr:alpha/beta hydrolase [Nocardioides nematodiphilus]MCA1982924.1 alpha/beta fold hydrolase [Nocardioides nematodiphilus]
MTVSELRLATLPSGIELCYQTFGDPADEPLLLVMGLSCSMVWWHDALCEELAAAGFHVIRFDNRDVGRSSKLSGRTTIQMMTRAFAGLPTRAVYWISDMTVDAVGLLDVLGIERAHVCGVSMGGMIAQTMAVEHPTRVASLVSIMSTTGGRRVGWQHPVVLPMMLRPAAADREGYVQRSVAMWQLIGSPGYRIPVEDLRATAEASWEHGVSAAGVGRQTMAVLTQPNRARALSRVTAPTAVVHGTADRMVHVSGGRATARAIPDAELRLIEGMGHDLPRELWPTYVDVIRQTAERARH